VKGHAKVDLDSLVENAVNIFNVSVHNEQKKHLLEAVEYLQKNPDTKLEISLEGRGTLIDARMGILMLQFDESPLLKIENVKNRRSNSQHTTLRGIERFIFIAENGYEPSKDDLYWIHEGLLEKYSIWTINPRNGVSTPKRTSNPSMSTVEMAKIVQGALDSLSVMQIPKEVLNEIGHDMKKLWENWYRWRYDQDKDPLFEAENELDWEKYKELHPVCEFCSLPDYEYDPLIRMHIVSKGANIGAYERAYNWIRAHNSHHILQHNEGWEIIEKSYPHIIGKLKRARLMQGEGEKNAS